VLHGRLIANTAIPVWSEARGELPWLFGVSAAASAGAASTLLAPLEIAGPARRAAIGGAGAVLGLTALMEKRLGQGQPPSGNVSTGRAAANPAVLVESRQWPRRRS